MKKYDNYKESGIEWLGKIPEDWEVVKLKHIVDSVETGKTPSTTIEEYFENGHIDWYSPGDFTSLKLGDSNKKITDLAVIENKLSLYPINTILLIGIGATLGKVAVTDRICFTNQQINAIIPSGKMDPFFGLYYLDSIKDVIRNESNASTMAILNQSKTKDLIFIKPSLHEQTTIASYLDHKTTQIDSLIEKKEKLIEKLKLQRQAIINEAVTKGLNPDAPMKDSGIEWLGKIPKHWEAIKLKYIANITRGAILRPVDEPSYFDDNGKWTYLNISDATKCNKYLDEGKLRLSELGSTKSARVEPNNLIITASATIGKPFINRIPVCVHDGFIPITELKCDIDFLYQYISNPQLYVAIGKSNTQKNIYLDEVKDMIISLPPKNEQKDIASYLEITSSLFEQSINKLESSIEKLKLYRQSIISEAVTGKIDVRDWKKPEKK